MRIFSAVSVIAFMLCCCNREEVQPNILFIFADDQCYNTIREMGNLEVMTPTLDELARRGAR